MESIKPFVVLTTIAEPSLSFFNILTRAKEKNFEVVVVGDRKTPKDWSRIAGITYIPVSKGEEENSYSRKNLGYLYAIKHGATHIFDMDDDNSPIPEWGQTDFSNQSCRLSTSPTEWLNIYKVFGHSEIWPRGLPLHAIYSTDTFEYIQTPPSVVIWQSLCNEDPDTDAIWRLINRNHTKDFYFGNGNPTVLTASTICPFNAQNTLFTKEAFPLLYLPCSVNMRFSDILRSIVAQPILWAAGYQVGFTGGTVNHMRHPHDLMKDFYDELECYANVEHVYEIVKSVVTPENSIINNLLTCYKALSTVGIVHEWELDFLLAWRYKL